LLVGEEHRRGAQEWSDELKDAREANAEKVFRYTIYSSPPSSLTLLVVCCINVTALGQGDLR
jgi:hypothetical protein